MQWIQIQIWMKSSWFLISTENASICVHLVSARTEVEQLNSWSNCNLQPATCNRDLQQARYLCYCATKCINSTELSWVAISSREKGRKGGEKGAKTEFGVCGETCLRLSCLFSLSFSPIYLPLSVFWRKVPRTSFYMERWREMTFSLPFWQLATSTNGRKETETENRSRKWK